MHHRDWELSVQETYLCYLVQYTSPSGTRLQTSPCFSTSEQAFAFAQARIDHYLECQRPRLAASHVSPN